METIYNDEKTMVLKAKVKRNWSNSFAENCYELEDGTEIYISYSNDEIRIEIPKQGTFNNIIKFNNNKDN